LDKVKKEKEVKSETLNVDVKLQALSVVSQILFKGSNKESKLMIVTILNTLEMINKAKEKNKDKKGEK
jgi:hypothetical protein